MSRITGAWKRSLRPVFVSAFRRLPGCGCPVPRGHSTVAEMVATGRATLLPIRDEPRRRLPPHGVSGDLAAADRVRSSLTRATARESFDRFLRGDVVQPASGSFTAVLPGGGVTHCSGVVTHAGAVLEEVSGLGFSDTVPTNPLRLTHLPRAHTPPVTVAVLSTGAHYNYYHWLSEALPRLELYERCGVPIDRFYVPTRYRFQRESLALLGIPADRILRARPGAHYRPACLVASSFRNGMTRAKVDFLHERLTVAIPTRGFARRRIFVSRRGRGARRIVNEPQVVAALAPLGFEPLHLESLSLAAQIAAFRDAECVVGPHGAGLTNLAFCGRGTRVVEIGTPYRSWTCFREIAHHRGLDYHLHLASPAHVRHFDPATGVGDSDLRVDPGGLAAVVQDSLDRRFDTTRRMAG